MQGMSAFDFRKDVVKYSNPDEYIRMEEEEKAPSLLQRIINSAKQAIPAAMSTTMAGLAQLSYSGSVGNFQSAEEPVSINGRFGKIVDQYPEKIGSPLCKAVVINTLSGYVVCKDAVIAPPTATGAEEDAITQFLNNGFYYE